MSGMKENNRWYKAAEVKAKLGITQGQLNTYIRNGTLKPITPPGKKQSVYLQSDVDQLAREMQAFMAIRQRTSSTFSVANEEDLKATVEITRVLFGLRDTPEATLARRLSWLKHNPETFYVLKSEGQVVGYAAMLPLKPEKIEKILSGEEFSQEVNVEEIEQFEPGKPLHIYMLAIGVIPGTSHYEKRSYGSRLIAGMMKTIIDFGRRGIVIDTFYARSDTPDGIRILKQGFTERPTVTHARNFAIKVRESGIPFIQEYKQALKESGKAPSEWI